MEKYKLPKSSGHMKKVSKLLPGGRHYNFYTPSTKISWTIPVVKGQGSRVWDIDGNEYLDLFCKFGALIVGHNNPQYNEALKKCIDKVLAADQSDIEFELCEKLVYYVPCAEYVRFGLSGTESVQNTLRLARAYTNRNRFIRFYGHYHGNADNIMGGSISNDLNYPIPKRSKDDMLETDGRAANIMEDQSFLLPWNDIKTLTSVVEQHHDDIAAILMEPICMNGGGVFPSSGYLEKTRALCDKFHIVLIFDEVITGMRVGLGGAQTLLNVIPDLTIYGKALAGGALPVSAIMGKRDIMKAYSDATVIHAGTFNGYPLGLAAALATFKIIEADPQCYERMAKHLQQIGRCMLQAAQEVGLPVVLQGVDAGLVYHTQKEVLERPDSYRDEVKLRDMFIRARCELYGIQISPISRIYANMMMTDDDVRFFQDRIGDVLADANNFFNEKQERLLSYRRQRLEKR